MDFIEYGGKQGRPVIYFHGAPGAMEECSIFEPYLEKRNLRLICFDRFAIGSSLDGERYFQQIVDQIRVIASNDSVDLIGFSIGSYIALEIGVRLEGQVRQTHLVSPVAPIAAGDYLDHMAGATVFKLARDNPVVFSMLTYSQKILATLSPRLLVRMLFAESAGKDKALSEQEEFKNYLTPLLRHCFCHRTSGYKRDIKLYVNWPGYFEDYNVDVHLWHGTKDNWSPFSMSSYLNKALPASAGIEAMDGLSHYSTLFESALRICEQLEPLQ